MFELPVVAVTGGISLVLNIITMHSLPVQEARSLKSRCGLGWGLVSSGSSEGEPTACLSPSCWWPPGTLGVPRLAAASSQPLSPSSPGLSLPSPFLSLTRTPVTGFRVTLAQVDLFGKIRCFLIFGYTGPSLLCRDFSRVAGSRAFELQGAGLTLELQEQGLLSSCREQGFSLQRLLLPQSAGSRCAGFSSCGHRLRRSAA